MDPSALIRDRRVDALAKAILGVSLLPYQCQIVEAILYRSPKRVCISAFTRGGKTYSTAVGIALLALLGPDDLRIRHVAPTVAQSQIMRRYVADLILESPELQSHLDLAAQGVDKLRKEVSRHRLTFANGSDIMFLSAEGTGARLMGLGADVLILDESALIKSSVYTSRLSRMLGDNPGASLIELGNPWHRSGHFYRHWTDPAFHNIHIPWSQGVAEGRITESFVSEQRRELSPTEFQVLWDAEFPVESEDQLLSWEWLERARGVDVAPRGASVWGLDVAEGGVDLSVLSHCRVDGDYAWLVGQESWHRADTMDTVERVRALVPEGGEVVVDATGVGKGVADALKSTHHVRQLKVGRRARNPDRFANLKAEVFWGLRERLESGRLGLGVAGDELLRQLACYRLDTSSGKVRVVEDGNKSPDHGDSLAYALWRPRVVGRGRGPRPI